MQPEPPGAGTDDLDEHTAQDEAPSTVNPTTLGHFIRLGGPATTPDEPDEHYHVVVAKFPTDQRRSEPASGPSVNQPSDRNEPDGSDSDDSVYTRNIYIQVAHGGGRKVRRLAKMDTGADVNVMARDVQEAVGYKLEPYSELVKPFGSKPILPLGRVRGVEWNFGGHPKTYTEDFFVFDTDLFDTLIGKPCIKKHKLYTFNPPGSDT